MSYTKRIKTEEDHKVAIKRLSELMDMDLQPGTALSDELEVLALLIADFEKAQFPIEAPDPIEAIKFRMEQQGFKESQSNSDDRDCFESV